MDSSSTELSSAQSQSQSQTQSWFSHRELLPRAVIFLIVKLRWGFSQLVFVYVLFSFNIFLITYSCVMSSFEPPLGHSTILYNIMIQSSIIYLRVGWKVHRTMLYWLLMTFWPIGFKHCDTNGDACGLQKRPFWKISLIWSHFMWVFWSADELFSWLWYIKLDDCIYDWPIGLVVDCLPMVQETGIQSQVESYQRLDKWYLIPPCLTLSIIKYISKG